MNYITFKAGHSCQVTFAFCYFASLLIRTLLFFLLFLKMSFKLRTMIASMRQVLMTFFPSGKFVGFLETKLVRFDLVLVSFLACKTVVVLKV